MDVQDWKMLTILDQTENITQAADQLFVSQPTLTARIKRLEEHYQVPIIIRKRRGIMFTPEGRELALHAKKMLQQEQVITEKINNMKSEVAGTLRVGVSNFFALNKMPKLLRLFKEKYPNVEFRVFTGWSSEMHRELLNHNVHISFIKGDYPWKGEKELLYDEEICVAAPWEFEWKELPKLPRIDYFTDGLMRNIVDRWWYNHYSEMPSVHIQVNEVETCKEMVINGLGYAILANLVVRQHPELFIKPIRDTNGETVTRKTWMYYHNESTELNIVQAFITFIRSLDVKTL
ncbi:LysR family transcriptional regulator [Aquibacillus sediminis]|uniref:LysR family transcriptional regulator n=1 Tax=Aquibacillus sediminis TaxID=2574734 RepID=UPI001108368D|nr:LysR family transcriptional regulator [Aquibacillus sediminis]